MALTHYDSLWAFAHEVIQLAWDANIDGADVQELALKYGLIQPAIYDPERHGHNVEAEPGDEIFEFTEEMK
jgi:hypothetical protein